MNAITVVAIIGAASTLLSAGFAGWASIKQRRTEDVRLGYDAMRTALDNYRTDNADLRNRVFVAEQRVTAAESRVATAERRVADLTAQLDRYARALIAAKLDLPSEGGGW